jgi:hypothetical protein
MYTIKTSLKKKLINLLTMASLNYQNIFGIDCLALNQDFSNPIIRLNKHTFVDADLSGELPVGIGLASETAPTATQMLYGILMLLKQHQAPGINDDPTQKAYITDAGKSIATGTRDGQVKRSFTISFFIDAGLAGIPGIDQIDN